MRFNRLFFWLALGSTLAAAIAGCTKDGADGSETHFVICSTDADCTAGQHCVAQACVASDAGVGGAPSGAGGVKGSGGTGGVGGSRDAGASTGGRGGDASADASTDADSPPLFVKDTGTIWLPEAGADSAAALSHFAFDFVQRLPLVERLNAAAAFSPMSELVVGGAGNAFSTSDLWSTYTRTESGTRADLRGLARLDAETVIAVGDTGTILLGTHAGTAWSPCSNLDASLQRLNAVTVGAETQTDGGASNGIADVFAVGDAGIILRGSVSFGASGAACGPFAVAQTPVTTHRLLSVAVDRARSIALAVGPVGTIFRSTDGGSVWSAVTAPAAYANESLGAVTALAAGAGFLVGAGPSSTPGQGDAGLLFSSDGTTFAELAAFSDIQVTSLSAVDATHAYVLGQAFTKVSGSTTVGGPKISVATNNGGWQQTLSTEPPGVGGIPYSIDAYDATHAVWSGTCELMTTSNGGQTWDSRTQGARDAIRSVAIVPSDPGSAWVIASPPGTYYSPDHGKTWTAVPLVPAPADFLYDVAMTSSTQGFIVGSAGAVYELAADGKSWTPHADSGFTLKPLYDVACLSASLCYANGDDHTLARYDGSHWSLVAGLSPSTDKLAGLALYGGLPVRGIVVGDNGYVATLNTDTWTERTAVPGAHLSGVAAKGDGSGLALAVGYTVTSPQTALVFRSTDDGATWSSDPVPAPAPDPGTFGALRSVRYDAGTHAWYIVGYYRMYKSTNDGASWQALDVAISGAPITRFDVSGSDVYAVGNCGMVLHSGSGGE